MLLEVALDRDRPSATPGTDSACIVLPLDEAPAPVPESLGEREQSEGETSKDIAATCGVVSGTKGGTSGKILLNGKNRPGTFPFQAVGRSPRETLNQST